MKSTMKNRKKPVLNFTVLAAVTFIMTALASCAEDGTIYIRNNRNDDITVSITSETDKNRDSYTAVPKTVIENTEIISNSTKTFTVYPPDDGYDYNNYFVINYFVTSNPGIKGSIRSDVWRGHSAYIIIHEDD